tara:strand:+ start:338 stop:601 length:264 start_codon:yes stop_codon:yes gene_type:complete
MKTSMKIKTSNKFGSWLKDFCNEHNISAADLARSVGVHRRLVTRWIRGTGHPRFVNGLFVVEALSKMTGQDELEIYVDMRRQVRLDF